MSEAIAKLKERYGETLKSAELIQGTADGAGRPLTKDEDARIASLMVEHETLKVDIARRERIEAARVEADKSTRQSVPSQPEVSIAPVGHIEFPHRGYAGRLKAFKPRDGETQAQAVERAYRSGMWLMAMFGKPSAQVWCRDHGVGVQIRAQSEGVNSYGGVLVPDEMEASIIDLRDTYGTFRKYARVRRMTRDTMTVPRVVGGLTAYPVGEAAAGTESTKTWDNILMSAKKWMTITKISSELAEDAIIDVADDTTKEIAIAFANKEDDCGFNGTGASTYHGVTGILQKMIDGSHAGSYHTAAGAGGTVDTFGEVVAADLAGVMAKLPDWAYQKGTPRWFVPSVGKALIFDRLANALSGNSKGDIATANIQTYCGYEIVKVPVWVGTPTTDFSGIIMALFGDLSLAATFGDRRGTEVAVNTALYQANDQIGIFGFTRWDINVHDIGGSTLAGGVVGLLGN